MELDNVTQNQLNAEFYGEAAALWHRLGLELMARHYAATAAHCARLAMEGLPSDLMTWEPVFTK